MENTVFKTVFNTVSNTVSNTVGGVVCHIKNKNKNKNRNKTKNKQRARARVLGLVRESTNENQKTSWLSFASCPRKKLVHLTASRSAAKTAWPAAGSYPQRSESAS